MFTLKVKNIPGATPTHIASNMWRAQFQWYKEPLEGIGIGGTSYYDTAGGVPPFEATATIPGYQGGNPGAFYQLGVPNNYPVMTYITAGVDLFSGGVIFAKVGMWSTFYFKDGGNYVADFASGQLYEALFTGLRVATVRWRNTGPAIAITARITVGDFPPSSAWLTIPENGEGVSQHAIDITTPGTFPVLVEAWVGGVAILRAQAPDLIVV